MRFAVAAVCLFTSSRAFAGAYMEVADKDLADTKAPPRTSKIWAQGGNTRMEANNGTVIFKSNVMYIVNDADKKYMVIDKTAVDKMSKQMSQVRAQADEHMKNVPPEQRAKMEKMMAQNGLAPPVSDPKPARTLKQTSRTASENGKSCAVWEAHEGDVKVQELCVAPMSAVAGSQELITAFKSVGNMFEGMKVPGQAVQADPFQDFERLNGIPVVTRDFEGGKAVREHRLVTARAESVPAASFEPPAGYKAEQMPTTFGESGTGGHHPGARP
ncbi:MAG: hypothetical protein H7Z43_07925 [Clostridia bacterium]|nr:hypothetical protein [Deltaproteobacteria bacterium]